MNSSANNLTPSRRDASQADEATDTGLFPKILGDFELQEMIGRGGMGTVYRASQRSLDRIVAVKVLSQQVSASPNAVLRFQREAQAAAKLHHPHIVPIFSLCEENGVYYYAMELVDGPGLHTVIAGQREQRPNPTEDTVRLTPSTISVSDPSLADTQPLPPAANPSDSAALREAKNDVPASAPRYAEIAEHIANIADALHYAHLQGVIHRDIKPHNLLFGSDGHLRITDFGLARLTEQPGVTVTGELIGSPLYMAPEQLRGETNKADPRSDIYSLGATLYEWLTFEAPYPGDTRERVISKILTSEAPPARSHDPAIPVDLETICSKAIERDIRRRYQSAAELRDDLRRFLENRPIKARRAGWGLRCKKFAARHQLGMVGAAAAVMAIALGGLLVSKDREVRRRDAAVAQMAAENDRLRDLLTSLPFEIGGPLRLAEAAAPVLEKVVTGSGTVDVLREVRIQRGADPSAAGTPGGIVRRAVRDFYDALAPDGWPTDAEGDGPADSFLLRSAVKNWVFNPGEALASLKRYMASSPEHARQFEAWQMTVALQGRLGADDDMLTSANMLVRLKPDDHRAHTWRALCYLRLKRPADGLADAEAAIQLSAPSVWSLALKGLLLTETNSTVDAVFTFNRALEHDPDHVISLLGRAGARARADQPYDAIADLSHVLELEPDNADVLAFRGDQYVSIGDFEAAERDFAQAISLAGTSTPMLIRYLGAMTQRRRSAPDEASPGTDSTSRADVESAPVDPHDRTPPDPVTDWFSKLLRQNPPLRTRARPARDRVNLPPRAFLRLIE